VMRVRCQHSLKGYFVSRVSSALMFMCPLETMSFLSHTENPRFFTTISWSPDATPIVEGVLPTNLPSISMSAASGVETTWMLVCSLEAALAAVDLVGIVFAATGRCELSADLSF